MPLYGAGSGWKAERERQRGENLRSNPGRLILTELGKAAISSLATLGTDAAGYHLFGGKERNEAKNLLSERQGQAALTTAASPLAVAGVEQGGKTGRAAMTANTEQQKAALDAALKQLTLGENKRQFDTRLEAIQGVDPTKIGKYTKLEVGDGMSVGRGGPTSTSYSAGTRTAAPRPYVQEDLKSMESDIQQLENAKKTAKTTEEAAVIEDRLATKRAEYAGARRDMGRGPISPNFQGTDAPKDLSVEQQKWDMARQRAGRKALAAMGAENPAELEARGPKAKQEFADRMMDELLADKGSEPLDRDGWVRLIDAVAVPFRISGIPFGMQVPKSELLISLAVQAGFTRDEAEQYIMAVGATNNIDSMGQ